MQPLNVLRHIKVYLKTWNQWLCVALNIDSYIEFILNSVWYCYLKMRNDNVINKISYAPFLKTSFCHISLIQILISQNAVFTLPIRKLLLKYVCVKSIDPILWSLSGNDKVYGTNKLKLSCILLSHLASHYWKEYFPTHFNNFLNVNSHCTKLLQVLA